MISKTYYRYLWLLNLLLESDPLPFDMIAMAWEMDPLGEGELPLRTFHEHRKGIKELFGVDIVCDKAHGFNYYVRNPEALDANRLGKWLLEAYNVPSGFATYRRMQDRVLLEEMTGGTAFVDYILDALQRDVKLVVDYQGYEGPHEMLHVHPYALKAYDCQWYLLGYIEEKQAIRPLALCRFLDLSRTDRGFDRPTDFDARRYFEHVVGIHVDEALPVETVRIRAYGVQMECLRDNPLHHSQAEVKTRHGEYAEFTCRVCITPELISKLLAMGEGVEVIGPEGLREEMRKRILLTLQKY